MNVQASRVIPLSLSTISYWQLAPCIGKIPQYKLHLQEKKAKMENVQKVN